MKRLPRIVAVVVAGLCLAATACGADNKLPDNITAILDKATEIELLSLDPTPRKDDDKDFHGYKILGKTTVKDAETRKALLAALYKGIKDSDGSAAKCFNPRHGVRATVDSKTVELVICFECLQIATYPALPRMGTVLTTRHAESTFNKVLTEAKVPLPKGEN
jgi:hypothetical protein